MYTQCPDCSTAFRVTAEILKQAAGKVRCGGCGNAFNALEYLSESMPGQTAAQEVDPHLPELTPEPLQRDSSLPESISAEQSAALLKTLDELAGSDIRIEDTGVEWRVLDDDEIGEAADDDVAVDPEVEDQPDIDEILEDSPTPVDQFLTDTPPEIESPEIFAEDANGPARTPVEELRFDDNTPLPDDFDLDDESSYVPRPEPEPEPEPEPVVPEAPQVDLELSEPDEWTDILDEFEGLAEDLADPAETPASEADEPTIAEDLEELDSGEIDDEPEEPIANEPLDMDSQFALQAEAMGIDLSGMHETLETEEPPASDVDDLETLLEESGEEVQGLGDLLDDGLVDDDTVGDLDVELEIEAEAEAESEAEAEEDELDESAQLDLIDDIDDVEDVEDEIEVDDEALDEHYVPPMTEEEQTINMQIDQDLLAIAVADDDGFSSTMVLPEDATEDKAAEDENNDVEAAEDDSAGESADPVHELALKDTGAGFETIIMEGSAFRSDVDEEKQEADKAAAAASLASSDAKRQQKENEERALRRRKYGLAAGIVALILVLAGQYIHQNRESLATIPAFNDVVGPMYRAVGKPLSPEWDITGWRFEATRGSTDEGDENLTIYSRLGNKSDQALPYPLIGISLTDRFEETIGSRVLDPAEYLTSDLDPRKLVQPGNTFNAVITIDSPGEEAIGFKLNVCYRESGGDLRCAIDDFK